MRHFWELWRIWKSLRQSRCWVFWLLLRLKCMRVPSKMKKNWKIVQNVRWWMKNFRSFRKRQNNRLLSYRKSYKRFRKTCKIAKNRLSNRMKKLNKKSRNWSKRSWSRRIRRMIIRKKKKWIKKMMNIRRRKMIYRSK